MEDDSWDMRNEKRRKERKKKETKRTGSVLRPTRSMDGRLHGICTQIPTTCLPTTYLYLDYIVLLGGSFVCIVMCEEGSNSYSVHGTSQDLYKPTPGDTSQPAAHC